MSSDVIPSERFKQPENFQTGYFINADHKRLRYGYLASPRAVASALFVGGTNQILEEDFENFRDWSKMGLDIFALERYGEGGSDHHYPEDPQKQANVPFTSHVQDMYDFIARHMQDHTKPRILIGHCMGGMVSLLFLSKYDGIFDHAFLTTPFLRLILKDVTVEKEIEIANSEITAENERTYIGKGQDWNWDLAQKLLSHDKTTHDPVRAQIHDLWLKEKPELRLGANTHASMVRKAQALQELLAFGVLHGIQTPVTIISPGKDTVNDPIRHAFAASHIPKCDLHKIEGAGHGLWREKDEYRTQVFSLLEKVVERAVSRKNHMHGRRQGLETALSVTETQLGFKQTPACLKIR